MTIIAKAPMANIVEGRYGLHKRPFLTNITIKHIIHKPRMTGFRKSKLIGRGVAKAVTHNNANKYLNMRSPYSVQRSRASASIRSRISISVNGRSCAARRESADRVAEGMYGRTSDRGLASAARAACRAAASCRATGHRGPPGSHRDDRGPGTSIFSAPRRRVHPDPSEEAVWEAKAEPASHFYFNSSTTRSAAGKSSSSWNPSLVGGQVAWSWPASRSTVRHGGLS